MITPTPKMCNCSVRLRPDEYQRCRAAMESSATRYKNLQHWLASAALEKAAREERRLRVGPIVG